MDEILEVFDLWKACHMDNAEAMTAILKAEASDHEKINALWRLAAHIELWNRRRI